MTKTAVVLFNLGGPDCQRAVQSFLFNLFADRAIIRLPILFRLPLAWLISTRRAPIAREIYQKIGGGSPILPQTQAQADALQNALGPDYKTFICMRYWHPMSAEVAKAVKAYAPDRIVLLPLYPQYSTTTTASSLNDWKHAVRHVGLICPTHTIESYPTESGFISAHVEAIRMALAQASTIPRLLFSAHGLPERIVAAGDPYPKHVKQSVEAVMQQLALPELEYVICYQSRVGPLQWIGPSTEEEIKRACIDQRAIIIIPIAFVSEHSETLVELDIEYAHLAKELGATAYLRTPTPTTHPAFMEGLARLVKEAVKA